MEKSRPISPDLITLCTHGLKEDKFDVTPPYSDVALLRVAVEDVTEMEFARNIQ